MRIALLTLGCRTNQAESYRLEEMISQQGHEIVDLKEGADICIINTCSVTSKADYQSRQSIARALRAKSKVIVTGCYAELNEQKLKNIDKLRLVRNSDKESIINYIPTNYNSITLKNIDARHRPTIKVQDGCDNSCSYCIIPTARGRSRSVNPLEIIEEVKRLESMGYSEVVLSGIHLGMYGRDLTIQYDLAKLLEEILLNTSKMRIRLSSIEINEISDSLLCIIEDNRICKHFHLPLQSGDDKILSLMNRKYTIKEYSSTLDKIAGKIDNISIGTDIIVGFPAEDDSNFENTLNFIDSHSFTYLHVFPYSPRPGTPAASMRPQVKDLVKKNRVMIAREAGLHKRKSFMMKNIGQDHEIIIESMNEEVCFGTTSNYIKVSLKGYSGLTPGSLVRIRITGLEHDVAVGIPI